jgi:hypothetical protein
MHLVVSYNLLFSLSARYFDDTTSAYVCAGDAISLGLHQLKLVQLARP